MQPGRRSALADARSDADPHADPHLGEPASAQAVFSGFGREGLKVKANTADVGAEAAGVVTRIHATYSGWPLQVVEYRSSADLAKAASWEAGRGARQGRAADRARRLQHPGPVGAVRLG